MYVRGDDEFSLEDCPNLECLLPNGEVECIDDDQPWFENLATYMDEHFEESDRMTLTEHYYETLVKEDIEDARKKYFKLGEDWENKREHPLMT